MLLLLAPLLQDYNDYFLNFNDTVDNIIYCDVNADGLSDLIVQVAFDLNIYINTNRFLDQPSQVIRLDSSFFLWTTAKLPGDKVPQSIVIMSSRGVHCYRPLNGKEGTKPNEIYEEKPQDLLVHPTIFAGRTTEKNPAFFAEFAPDINGDKLSDIVLFAKDQIQLFVWINSELELVEKINIPNDRSLEMYMGSYNKLNERLLVSHLTFGDVNSDGKQDLVIQKSGIIRTFIQGKNCRFTEDSNYSINQGSQGSRSYFKVDINPQIRDLNGDGTLDFAMVYPTKGKILIYYSRKDRVNFMSPDDEVKVDGSWIFGTFFYDMNADGKQDLVLSVIRRPSFAEAIGIFVNKKIPVDLCMHTMEETGFSKQPKCKMTFEVPFSVHLSLRSGLPDLFFYPKVDGDFNKDGLKDLLVISSKQGPLTLYNGNKETLVDQKPSKELKVDVPAETIFAEPMIFDLNNDKASDIVLKYSYIKDKSIQTRLEIKLSK